MVNQVVLIGRITKDLEVKSTTTGRDVINFTIAVNRNFKNAQGEYEADFINCVAYGNTAKYMGQYIQKGRLISVVGRINTRNYENTMGQRVYVTEVIADNVSSLEARRESNPFEAPANNFDQGPAQFVSNNMVNNDVSMIDDSELPF